MFIYDYIIYNGEPIIEFRLKYLNDYVDYFIITESIYTHSGKKKDDFYYYINKDIFEPYRKKILFHSIHVLPSEIDCLNIRKNNLLYENKDSWINEVYQRDSIQKIMNTTQYFKPFIIFVCDVDEIPKKELYMNIKNDYDLLHNGAHIQMLLLNYGFKWKKENCIWKHPFVITDRGNKNLSFSNVRLRRTEKTYNNSGWHVTYCFKIDDIIRKLESFAHTEYNLDKYKNKEYLLKCIQEGKNILNEDEQFVQTEDEELPYNYEEFQEKIDSFYN
jgi:beta-1,4-mannosyl-glycoprotein beta-1,4-N-acetylglucosaminyltransferase